MSSALPRPLVMSYPSNRLAAAALLVGLWSGKRLGGGWPAGWKCALDTFCAWSLTRELDPDHHETSEVAALLALAYNTWQAQQEASESVSQPARKGAAWQAAFGDMAMLSSLRLLVASVGPVPTTADQVQLLGLGVLSSAVREPVQGLLPAVCLHLSASLADRHSPPQRGQGLLGAALSLVAYRLSERSAATSEQTSEQIIDLLQKSPNSAPQVAGGLNVLALAFAPALARPEKVQSFCDERPVHILPERLRLTRQVALGTLAAAALRGKSQSVAPLALACAVVGMRRLVSWWR